MAALLLAGCGHRCPEERSANYYLVTGIAFNAYCYSSSYCTAEQFTIQLRSTLQGIDRVAAAEPHAPLVPVLAASSHACYDEAYNSGLEYARPILWIDSVRITSDYDWNAVYPAGSNLAPLFYVGYANYFHGSRLDTVAQSNVTYAGQALQAMARQGMYVPSSMDWGLYSGPDSDKNTQRFHVYLRLSDHKEYTFDTGAVYFQ